MRWYYSLVLRHPYVLLGAVFTLGGLGVGLIFLLSDRPLLDFSDPKLGFETRGTVLSDRIRTLNYLIESTVRDPSQILRPADVVAVNSISETSVDPPVVRPNREIGDRAEISTSDESAELTMEDENVRNVSDGYFCDTPRSAYSKIVFELRSDSASQSQSAQYPRTLFTAENIRSMCHVENTFIQSSSYFAQSCITETHSGRCCRSWSLGNYVALLGNKSSCDFIDDNDVALMLNLLKECSADFTSNLDCFTASTMTPVDCFTTSVCQQNAQILRDVFFYIVDFEFLSKTLSNLSSLTHAASFLPLAAGQASKELYHSIEGSNLTDGKTKIVAIDFGIKYDLFDEHLLKDTIWLIAGLISIFILVWVYTASLWFTCIVMITLFVTIETSYVIYTLVARLRFFPFINLLIVVIVVGVGVDDAFVYLRLWDVSRSRKDAMTPEGLVAYTIKTSARSMFATSATTSAAMYTGAMSKVVALRCFGIFAGTTLAVCFLLTLIAIPAACVARVHSCKTDKCSIDCGGKLRANLCEKFNVIFERYLPFIVYRARYVSIILFSLLGISGALVIFVHPKLRMPTTSEMKLFSSSHPFEVYDSLMRERFASERVVKSTSVMSLPLTFVWGVKAHDSSSGLDPMNGLGHLLQDKSFNLSSESSQRFLWKFCRRIRSTGFYRSETGMQLTNCFIENFRSFMRRPCEVEGHNWAPCCRTAKFPFAPEIFEKCLQIYLPELLPFASNHEGNSHAGVRYSKQKGKPIAIIVEFPSIVEFTANYSAADEFFRYMENWTTNELSEDYVPDEMKSGWFVSELTFYDLQNVVAMGTPTSVAVALAIVAIVSFITTFNVILTIEAMVTVTLAVSTTVGFLVLIGWELNVVESVTISITVGLSVDYTMHYAVAYQRVTARQSACESGERKMTSVASDIGGTITMAALTTLVVGLWLLPAAVLAYRQLAAFLIIIVIVSYLYAVFFFQALLLVIRPRCWHACSLTAPRCFTGPPCYSGVRSHVDKTVYRHVSESNVSSSVSANRITNSSDLHETELQRELLLTHGESEKNRTNENQIVVVASSELEKNKNIEKVRRILMASGEFKRDIMLSCSKPLENNNASPSEIIRNDQLSNREKLPSTSDVIRNYHFSYRENLAPSVDLFANKRLSCMEKVTPSCESITYDKLIVV